MNEYRIETYGNGDRPGDVERLEEFIIQPKQPWFSEAEQRLVKKSLLVKCGTFMIAGVLPVSKAVPSHPHGFICPRIVIEQGY